MGGPLKNSFRELKIKYQLPKILTQKWSFGTIGRTPFRDQWYQTTTFDQKWSFGTIGRYLGVEDLKVLN